MAQDPNNLIWIDMEMSGLNPDIDRVLEVAVVVTDTQLNTVAEAPVLVVHQPDALLGAMDSWNTATHAKSGLVERVRASTLTEAAAERQMIAFLEQFVPSAVSPMCGSSVHQDRRFIIAISMSAR
jgi:oligoribonuclease